ncbi:Lipid transfer-like protein [Actinidia chinensis var. chinensis]|uniref:Lipid transfer-like protein n=1 Tax=Actinidia chinensis var. chinensis TaxID=1590841 RepID=A0A2R6R0U6_ACTCC|nr:Lipid transfer-like protein [Actinidia chinensis var. chinensis]
MRFTMCCGIGMLQVVVLIMLAVLVADQGRADHQADTSCVNRLLPCLNYLNGTHDPPNSCCDPLKSVIKSNPECLCSMISIKGTKQAEEAGINVTEAQQLPGRCGQHVNPIACLTNAASPANSKNSVPNSATTFSFSYSQSMPILTAVLSMILISTYLSV